MNILEKLGKGIIPMAAIGAMTFSGIVTAQSGPPPMTEITIFDEEEGGGAFYTGTGQGREDNEVEAGSSPGQDWDLEGMFIVDTSGYEFEDDFDNYLIMVGGYDFANGNSGYTSGSIFIAVGEEPEFGDDDYPDGTTMGHYGYDYVIDVNWETGEWAAYGGDQDVFLSAFDFNDNSNPWKVDNPNGKDNIADGDAYAENFEGDFMGKTGSNPGDDNDHYAVMFEIDWLAEEVDDDSEVWFHFTMGCGNDNLMGHWEDGPNPGDEVPEPASILLLGMGLTSVIGSRVRKKRF